MHILLAIGEHAVETHRKTDDAPRAFNLLRILHIRWSLAW